MTSPSATLDAMPTSAERPRPAFYWRLWRAFPRDIGYLALLAVLLPTAYGILYAIFWGGIGSIGAIVGIFLVLASLYVARVLGAFELRRIRWAQPGVVRPVIWNRSRETNAFLRLFAAMGNPYYWLYLLHGLLVLPLVGIVTLTITGTWIFVGLTTLLYPIYSNWAPAVRVSWGRAMGHLPFTHPIDQILTAIIGLALIAFVPFLTRGFVHLHFAVDRLVLGGFRSRVLEQQVSDLAASRSAAVAAEGTALRRLERDIHDGPQQRLVRLQMDIAAAQRQLDTDPAKASELLDGAMTQSKEALDELRALSRGFAPPLLLDRGLVAALESLVDRSDVHARLVNNLGPETVLPPEIERNAYFIASELLTNVDKHSGATDVELKLETSSETDVARWLDLTVTDNGTGGAAPVADHGLAGLEERIRGLTGTLEISSPKGGPTVVAARLPLG